MSLGDFGEKAAERVQKEVTMVNLKEILSMVNEKQKDDSMFLVESKAIRREKAARRFSLLCDKERDKLFNMITRKFPPYEFHLSGQNMEKCDFLGATSQFLNNFVFDLAIDIADTIKHELTKASGSKEVQPLISQKEVLQDAKYAETRYVN